MATISDDVDTPLQNLDLYSLENNNPVEKPVRCAKSVTYCIVRSKELKFSYYAEPICLKSPMHATSLMGFPLLPPPKNYNGNIRLMRGRGLDICTINMQFQ